MSLPTSLDAVRSILRSEIGNIRRFDIPWRRRLWLYWNGFLSSKDVLWDLDDGSMDLYLSDLEYREVKRIDEPYEAGLKNKVFFQLLLSRTHETLLPSMHGLLRAGRFVDITQLGWVQSFDQLIDHLENSPVVVKPVEAAKGDGVRVLDGRDGQLQINGRATDRAELVENLTTNRDLLLMDHVDQADYAANIYPTATNTVRLLTMIDPETRDPFIAGGTHRFGTTTSGRIDNWSAGGISAGIELDTGELRTAVSNKTDTIRNTSRIENHPDTGAQITGIRVPGWERVTETVLELAAEYGGLWPYVGWDLVVKDDQGSIAVFEGDPQSIDADLQAHTPLLSDDCARRFCEYHGVISNKRTVFSS